MQASIHDTIATIDPLEWDALSGPGHLFQSHAWLKAIEGEALRDYVPRYVVIRDRQGAMIATAAAFIMPTSLITLSSGPLTRVVEGIQRRAPWFLRPRILEAGSPLGPGNGISLRDGLQLGDIAPTLCDALERIAAAERISLIALRDFTEDSLPQAKALSTQGYVLSEGFATMALPLHWTQYEQYLGAMTGRHRQKVKRGLSLARRAGLRARWTRIGETGAQLARERENVRKLASEYRREEVTAVFFAQLDAAYGPRARVLEILEGSERVGHALVVEDGPVLRWLSFGRSESGARNGAYFLVLSSIVQLAIAEGRSLIDMGITTEGPKSDFGAARIRQWMALRFRGPLGRLLPLALKYLNPPRDHVDRRAFTQES